MSGLDLAFYGRDTLEVAPDLLGKVLVRVVAGRRLTGRIVEVEAYKGPVDKGAHSYNYRRTPRTRTMFGPPGHAYVYLVYGMHHCLNAVTEPEGEPCAILIRAVEPLEGRETMARFRYGKDWDDLTASQRRNMTNGPGKVCQAFSITREWNGVPLDREEFHIAPGGLEPGERVLRSRRIGIDYAEEAVDFLWRFTLEEEEEA
ncbi:DNA-3-methyladenine glycosylase [Anaerotalea alkaliphila]|uniref:Putative 3-methyladenine DNA glycosylase n=1 Tax=Anaerotalea alkaliphila TaxID=2662126 RepID=A0A7X5HTE3_9FIRM|nr:DNA-3-methyladenine glycosylase [Anaerotalea alkaliphila]NDL66335.1 DNA-3-methyladenine glycosylase [Anaerotalea alkaliphila]